MPAFIRVTLAAKRAALRSLADAGSLPANAKVELELMLRFCVGVGVGRTEIVGL